MGGKKEKKKKTFQRGIDMTDAGAVASIQDRKGDASYIVTQEELLRVKMHI